MKMKGYLKKWEAARMTIREKLEAEEDGRLSKFGARSFLSRRENAEEPCPIRTEYMRDRDRIIYSKAFRRLKHKTQVFISPEGDHYRTRLTHTLEVVQISRTIARALLLNEDLTEAIALGHDLGHTPFGHAGENALDELCSLGFKHNEQSLRIVEKLEKDGKGLNLTCDVRDGIVCHTGDKKADTLEGQIVHFADRIAYINHDIDDSIRADILKESDIPDDISDVLGKSHSKRIDTMVRDVVEFGLKNNKIGMSGTVHESMSALRKFMFENVYTNPLAKGEEQKGVDIIKWLYEYFAKDIARLPEDFKSIADRDGSERAVCDYVSGMTDRYAVFVYSDIVIPKGFAVKIKSN